MKTDENAVIVPDNNPSDEKNLKKAIVTEFNNATLEHPPVKTESTNKKAIDSTPSAHFLKLAKQFVIDGALLPDDELMPIEDRTKKRERLSFLRKQKNIENVIKKTLTYCANQEVKTSTDQDWFTRYIGLAEEVSNPTMQDLWAKILSGELAKPGSFSYKALKVFRDMSIIDAKLLAKACSLAFKDGSKKNIRLLSGSYQQPSLFNFFAKDRQSHFNLSKFGLNYADLLTLAENHLIYIQESELSSMSKDEKVSFTFNGLPLRLSARKNNVCLQFYKFTPLGTELANLITDKPNDEFFAYLKKQLNQHFVIDGV
jgi:uncharacterized repeat protein (TIGR03899 family)